MSFDYSTCSAKALILIAKYGLPVQFKRNGSVFAASYAFESEREASNTDGGTTELLAQTQVTTKTWLVPATEQAIRVGDYAVRDGRTSIVLAISEFRPAGTPIYQVIEVQ